MSKVNILRAVAKDTFAVQAATVATGWLPGQFVALTSTGEYVAPATSAGTFIGVAVDDDDELSAPPTGSLLTVVYGAGSRIQIDHAEEVAASSASRVYTAEVPSQSAGVSLYCDLAGKWTYNGNGKGVTGSVAGVMVGIPTATNNYTLEVALRA